MFRYGKSSWNIEYLEQNIKYKTHKIYMQNLTPHSQYVTRVLAKSSGLLFNGIFPIAGLVWISHLCLKIIFWN